LVKIITLEVYRVNIFDGFNSILLK